MTEVEFWNIIEAARDGADGDVEEVAERLEELLRAMTPEVIYQYMEHEARLLSASYTWALWGAAYLINGGCSDDGFHYFRGWLFAQGREVFEKALQNPDSLADIDLDDEAECEWMVAAAAAAYNDLTGDYPDGPVVMLTEMGEEFDFDDDDEMRARYPRLFAQYC